MIKKKILDAERVRKIDGGFSFIPHRFLCEGFFASLIPHELLLYFLLVNQTKRLARVPGARLPFYLKPFWNLLLYLARSQNWQKYDSTLKDRVIIDVRDEPFGDRELLGLDNLNIAEVLDAQGTDITDNALAAMHGLKHLRCLVLRKTHVTHEAVFRLQQSIPKCWIWY